MAKIIIQKNSGEEVKVIEVRPHTFKHSPHVLFSVAGMLEELFKAIDEVLSKEESEEIKQDKQ